MAEPTAVPEPEETAPDEAPIPTAAPDRAPEAVIESLPTTPEPVAASVSHHPQSVREILARVDDGWRWFRGAAGAFPSERMDEHLGEGGWTRKQMLAHVAAWHDRTADRLVRMQSTGKPAEIEDDTDSFNARIARQAVGRTAGEVLKDMEMTFNRLRRRLSQLTDDELTRDESWAAAVVAGNTYEHYDEHREDVYVAPSPDGRGGRR